MSETKNKTVQQRAEEKYPHFQIGQEAYLSGDHDRQAIADAEYKELQEKALAIITENGLLKAALRKEWVSVDTPPEKSGLILGAMHKTGDIYICHFKKHLNLYQVWGAGRDPILDMKVTHWKPIPKPPMDVCRDLDCDKPATREEYPDNGFYLCDEHFEKYKAEDRLLPSPPKIEKGEKE